jgi:hypothetical protein
VKDEGGAADLAPTNLDDDALLNAGQDESGAPEGDAGERTGRRDDLPPEDTTRFDAREAIAEKRREKRAEQVADQDEGAMAIRRLANDPDATESTDGGDDGEGDGSDAAADTSDPLLTLTIDGKKQQLRQSEVIARAQKAEAADNRLRDANALLDEVKALRAEVAASRQTNADGQKPNDATTERKAAPSSADQPDRKARAAQLVKDIQMGDADEDMADRLLSLVDEARGEGLTPDEARRVAREEYQREQDEAAAEEAFVRVTQANEVLVENPYVRQDFFGALVGQAIEELRSVVGMDDSGINTILRGTETLTPNQLVRINHDYFRRMTNPDGTPTYPNLSRPESLMKGAAAKAIEGWNKATKSGIAFVDPTASRPTASAAPPRVDRSARKQRIETHQPATNVATGAGVSRMANKAPQPMTREASKRAGFADIKAGRQTGVRR